MAKDNRVANMSATGSLNQAILIFPSRTPAHPLRPLPRDGTPP
jgi:hypothetical protein